MKLSEEIKNALRLAIESHEYCVHESPVLCHTLILAELELRIQRSIESDEELKACGNFIADVTLEGLMLKGMIEFSEVNEDGEMLIGYTEAGIEAVREIERKKKNGTD